MDHAGATVSLAARLSLGGVFAVSAALKAARPSAFSASLARFGVPAAGVAARLLPAVEAALAVGLVAARAGPWPAFAAIAFLAASTGAVVANLIAGRAVPCPCFGAGGGRPIGASTIARNGLLVAAAVLGTGRTTGASTGAALTVAALAWLGAVTVAAATGR